MNCANGARVGLLALSLFAGCATPPAEPPLGSAGGSGGAYVASTNGPAALAAALCDLSPVVDRDEATRAAAMVFSYARHLRDEYRVVGSPLFHNTLVNIGLRQRGLCYQWADDISAKLVELPLRTLVMSRGVAHLGGWREHSGVVLTTAGVPFAEGNVLDAWRHSGQLHWAKVKEDKYPWVLVNLRTQESLQPKDSQPKDGQ